MALITNKTAQSDNYFYGISWCPSERTETDRLSKDTNCTKEASSNNFVYLIR